MLTYLALEFQRLSLFINIDYCDFINNQPNNKSFCNNLEKLQYYAALAITCTTKGTSKLKMYEELGLKFFFNWDSLQARLNSHYEAWS